MKKPAAPHLDRIITARTRYQRASQRVDTLSAELASAKKTAKALASELLEQIDNPNGTLFDAETCEDKP